MDNDEDEDEVIEGMSSNEDDDDILFTGGKKDAIEIQQQYLESAEA